MGFIVVFDKFYHASPLNSTRISNELGAGSPKAAQLALRVTLFMALIVVFLNFLC